VSPEVSHLWNDIKNKIYDTEPRSLGYPSDSLLSTYYSQDITKDEISAVQKFLDSKDIRSENTRLRKKVENGQPIYELLVASAIRPPTQTIEITGTDSAVDGVTLNVVFGDHSSDLTLVIPYLEKAKQYAANKNQVSMIEAYIESFQTGSIEVHKESQKHWIKDYGPSVETNIGFVESLRDPQGIRAEWEGLVAIVNKEKSKKFAEMVERSSEFIVKLPWNGVLAGFEAGERGPFEAKKFMKPDYTSLEGIASQFENREHRLKTLSVILLHVLSLCRHQSSQCMHLKSIFIITILILSSMMTSANPLGSRTSLSITV